MSVYQVGVIMADGEVDSVLDWSEYAVLHVKELRALGYKVHTRLFSYPDKNMAWEQAQKWADKKEAWR